MTRPNPNWVDVVGAEMDTDDFTDLPRGFTFYIRPTSLPKDASTTSSSDYISPLFHIVGSDSRSHVSISTKDTVALAGFTFPIYRSTSKIVKHSPLMSYVAKVAAGKPAALTSCSKIQKVQLNRVVVWGRVMGASVRHLVRRRRVRVNFSARSRVVMRRRRFHSAS